MVSSSLLCLQIRWRDIILTISPLPHFHPSPSDCGRSHTPLPFSPPPLIAAVRQDHGPEAAEEVCEGLVLLREQGNNTARYWACPVCDQRFSTSKVSCLAAGP